MNEPHLPKRPVDDALSHPLYRTCFSHCTEHVSANIRHNNQLHWGDIRFSEISSETILGQKQSYQDSYMTCGVLHPIFGCPCMHLLHKPADIKFSQEKILWLTEQQVG